MRGTVESHADATRRVRARLSQGLQTDIGSLRRLRPGRRVLEIAFFTALWVASIFAGLSAMDMAGPSAWLVRLMAIAGGAAALNAFYLLSHEGHHHLLFQRPAVNHAANVLLCVPLLHSPSAYRVLHELHHRHLGGPGDPDEYRNYTDSPRLRWVLQWIRLTMGTLVYMPLIPVVAWRRAGGRERRWILAEYAGMGAVWVMVFAAVPLPVLLQTWLVPGIVVGYVSAVRALAQHALTHATDPALASRSVRSNAVVSFLLLNENYHLEHHLFPEVPSYNLPELRRRVTSRLDRTIEARSYTRFLAGFVRRSFRRDESVMGLAARAPAGRE
jgi:fatty acid desaturase